MKLYAPSYLYQYISYKEKRDWDNAIRCLKKDIEQNNSINYLREEFINCYFEKYSDRSSYAIAIELSGISESKGSLKNAIRCFEKNICIENSNFVLHKDCGFGWIEKDDGQYITIEFINLETRKVEFKKMIDIKAEASSIRILPVNHIWVILLTKRLPALKDMMMDGDKEKNREKVKNTLKIIINSFDNCSDLKQIENELTRNIMDKKIFDEKEWASWLRVAKDILETDQEFEEIQGKKGFFKVRLSSLTDEDDEKTAESFDFYHEQIQDIVAAFNAIPAYKSKLRKEFLERIKESNTDWPDIFCKIFPCCLDIFILDSLLASGDRYIRKVKNMFQEILGKYEKYMWPFVWLCENENKYSYILNNILPNFETIIENMLVLMDFTNRTISRNGQNNALDIIFSKYIEQYLFEPKYILEKRTINRLEMYIQNVNKEKAAQMIDRLKFTAGLKEEVLAKINEAFKNKFLDDKLVKPNVPLDSLDDVADEAEITQVVPEFGKFWATEAGRNKKLKEYDVIVNEKIPAQEEEIRRIHSLFGKVAKKAGLDDARQKLERLERKKNNLLEEIGNAQIFDKANLVLGRISFGTKVTLLNMDTNQDVVYTILGPFESDPDKNIISYQAPLAEELLGAKKYDELYFEMNDTNYNYKVLSIEASELI